MYLRDEVDKYIHIFTFLLCSSSALSISPMGLLLKARTEQCNMYLTSTGRLKQSNFVFLRNNLKLQK